jgi:hypothetical protein
VDQEPDSALVRLNENGTVRNAAIYNGEGLIDKRVDFEGNAHLGVNGAKVGTPHVVEYDYNTLPNGTVLPKPQPFVRNLMPGEMYGINPVNPAVQEQLEAIEEGGAGGD